MICWSFLENRGKIRGVIQNFWKSACIFVDILGKSASIFVENREIGDPLRVSIDSNKVFHSFSDAPCLRC